MELVRTGRDDGGGAGAAASSSSGGDAVGPRPAMRTGQADPGILRANTSVTAMRTQVQEAMENFLSAHTSVRPELLRVSGPPSGRSFVMRFDGLAREGQLHIEAVMRELRDRHGGWRERGVKQASGEITKLYVGRDKPRDQVLIETTGRRIARVIMGRCPGADVYHRRWDNLVLVDGQPIVRLVLAADGPPSVL